MKIISFIEREQESVIKKILRHCGLWKEPQPRPPPVEKIPEVPIVAEEPALDYGFFDKNHL
jgi:hypothetical protein